MDNKVLDEALEACAAGLREFGYGGLSEHDVRESYDKWKAGGEPTNVIDHFAFKEFTDRPELFGVPDNG